MEPVQDNNEVNFNYRLSLEDYITMMHTYITHKVGWDFVSGKWVGIENRIKYEHIMNVF